MKKSQPFLIAGLVLPALVALSACNGTQADDGSANGNRESTNSSTSPGNNTENVSQNPTEQGAQDPQQRLQEQQQRALLAQSIRNAKKNLDLGLFAQALREAVIAVEIDPSSEEARNLVERCQRLLGENPQSAQRAADDTTTQWLVEQQRDAARARELIGQATAYQSNGRHEMAVEQLRRAQLILEYSPHYSAGSALSREVDARLAQAREMQVQAAQAKLENDQLKSVQELNAEERRLRNAQRQKIERLYERANLAFQEGRYDASLSFLDTVLQEDPFNQTALALRDLARRANHDSRMSLLKDRWMTQYVRTIDELNQADVPQTDPFAWDMRRHLQVMRNKPIEFESAGAEETPEEAAILAKLNNIKQEWNFSGATLQDWARYFSDRTGVIFDISTGAAELDPGETTLESLSLPPRTAAQALSVIGETTGVKWKIEHGVVQLVTSEFAGGRTYLKKYDVHDIVEGVPNKPGQDLKLLIPGEEPPLPPEEEEPMPTVIDASQLVELIRDNIATESWDLDEARYGIDALKGTLMVRNNRQVHAAIDRLLDDLREAVGIQVDVESRFLRVQDNFLEDIGVDFRGLGNNSSEGVPGPGLGDRQNLGFDDFGRRENINPASPAQLGTGTEPGFFYDDGNDGDIFGRTENLYDSSLQAGRKGLNNGGGFSVQYAFLDDTQLEAILRAVRKQDRIQEITSPRLLVYNNTRANMSVLRQTTYVKDFEVEIAQAAAVANPVIGVAKDGVSLDVRPVVSADRRYITMELRPTVLDITLPIPTFTTSLGVGQPITIQLPETTLKRVRTTVRMPDGATVLLGGMKSSIKKQLESGVPIFSQIPVVSFFFGRRGKAVTNESLMIMIKSTIIIRKEHLPKLPSVPWAAAAGGGR